MTVAELIDRLKHEKQDREVRVYRTYPDGIRRAVPLRKVYSVNTMTREEKGLPEFIILNS